MAITQFVEEVKTFFTNVLNEQCRVLTIIKEEDHWKAVCEVMIDPNYTTRKGIGDMVEIYNVYLDDKSEVIGYELKSTKARATVDE